jgi:hypothetical protein
MTLFGEGWVQNWFLLHTNLTVITAEVTTDNRRAHWNSTSVNYSFILAPLYTSQLTGHTQVLWERNSIPGAMLFFTPVVTLQFCAGHYLHWLLSPVNRFTLSLKLREDLTNNTHCHWAGSAHCLTLWHFAPMHAVIGTDCIHSVLLFITRSMKDSWRQSVKQAFHRPHMKNVNFYSQYELVSHFYIQGECSMP